jgi:hypothetical protein
VARLLWAVLVLLLLLSSTGCSGFFHARAQTGSTFQGSVDTVQLGNVVDGTGETIEVTFVTFFADGVPFTIDFCDDQVVLFPLDETVFVDFTPGLTCSSIIFVEIVF